MSGMYGPSGPPAGPQRSPDGQWWWDGAAWRPTVVPPGAPTMGYPGAPTMGYPGVPTAGYPAVPAAGYPFAAMMQVPRPRPGFAVGGMLALLGAGAFVAGAVLPWATVSIGAVSASKSGTDGGDGWFFVGAAAPVLVLALIALAGRASLGIAIPLLLLGLGAGALDGFEFNDAHNIITSARNDGSDAFSQQTSVNYGVGLYVLAGGVALVLLGAVLEWMRRSRVSRRPVAR